MAERDRHAGLGIVSYELLPHLNRLDAEFLDKVQRHPERVACDLVAIEGGAARIPAHAETRCIGRGMMVLGGVATVMETA